MTLNSHRLRVWRILCALLLVGEVVLAQGVWSNAFVRLAGAAAPGDTDRSLALNGTAAYAEVAQTPELNLTGDWTIESWFKDEATAGYNHPPRVLFTKGDPLVDKQVPY